MGLERIRRVSPVMPVTPRRIYDAWLSSEEHSAFTGSPADVSSRKGGKFTAHRGYIEGTNVELEKGTRIVQTWRTRDFPEGAEDSQLEITFLQSESGTRVVINHGGIPEGQGERYHAGWGKNYFKPMSRYFLNHRDAPEVLQRAARSAAQKAASEAVSAEQAEVEPKSERAPKSESTRKPVAATRTASKPSTSKPPASKPGARRKAPGSVEDAPRSTKSRAKPSSTAPASKKTRRAAPAAAASKSTAKPKTRKPAKRKSG